MMTQELYALGSDRSARFARAFLDHFLPNRKPCEVDYPVPQYADAPEAVFTTEGEILEWLERRPEQPYSLYWNDASPSSYTQAMLFHTRDGKIVFGLALDTDPHAERLQDLAAFVGAEYAYLGWDWEDPPPDNSRDFIELCRTAEVLSITPQTTKKRR